MLPVSVVRSAKEKALPHELVEVVCPQATQPDTAWLFIHRFLWFPIYAQVQNTIERWGLQAAYYKDWENAARRRRK